MYYKVVNSDMSSAYIGGSYNNLTKMKVIYKLNEWVEPNYKGSKLMVFDDLDMANHFHYYYGWGNIIYKCEVKNPSKKGLFIDTSGLLFTNFLKALSLKNKKKKYTHLTSEPLLDNTIFCDAVKLIEKV